MSSATVVHADHNIVVNVDNPQYKDSRMYTMIKLAKTYVATNIWIVAKLDINYDKSIKGIMYVLWLKRVGDYPFSDPVPIHFSMGEWPYLEEVAKPGNMLEFNYVHRFCAPGCPKTDWKDIEKNSVHHDRLYKLYHEMGVGDWLIPEIVYSAYPAEN